VAILIVILLLSWVLPQSATADAAQWITTLPLWLQPWGELLYMLGFAHLLDSLWFWLPAALLLLNSLIALADYGPGSWRRLDDTTPPLAWQHPLARRSERVIRLPQEPDSFLEKLQTSLREQGFFIYQSVESEERLVGAARQRWAWFGFAGIHGGLVLLVVAFLVSHYFLQTERLTLVPLEPEFSRLLDGALELGQTPAGQRGSRLTFLAGEEEQPDPVLAWRLYQPTLFKGILIWPIAREPILAVEVGDEQGDLLRLIPVQEDLSPARRLNLPLTEAGQPLYFLIPSARLAVQISPDPAASSGEVYNVQIRRSSEEALLENTVIQAGATLPVENLSMTVVRHHSLTVLVYSDPAFFLYIAALLLILAGLLSLLLRPPVQIWLIPEVKGLGGQLYGLAETPVFVKAKATFLEDLLGHEEASEATAACTTPQEASAE
jgi:hypothetical protein